jgi:hypothetical protein
MPVCDRLDDFRVPGELYGDRAPAPCVNGLAVLALCLQAGFVRAPQLLIALARDDTGCPQRKRTHGVVQRTDRAGQSAHADASGWFDSLSGAKQRA